MVRRLLLLLVIRTFVVVDGDDSSLAVGDGRLMRTKTEEEEVLTSDHDTAVGLVELEVEVRTSLNHTLAVEMHG